MPAVNSVYIQIYNQKPVYRPGDELKGEWTVDAGEAFSVKAVSVSLHGAALTRWTNIERRADDNIGYEEIISQKEFVFPATERLLAGNTVDHPAGIHVYKFSFKIPREMIPSSYEGEYGAIRYWLSFDIERPFLRWDIRRIQVITVLDDIDVNLPTYSNIVRRRTEKTVTKALGFGNRGTVALHAQTDRGAYCPGEKIYINYTAENNSDKDLGRIKTKLMQEVNFRASGKGKTEVQLLKMRESQEELKMGERLSSTDNTHSITIPAVPPSTLDRASHIIKVEYHVKVLIDIPMFNGGDAMLILPITIGTIPQGHKAEADEASNMAVRGASCAITYTECTAGYKDGARIWSDKKFPRYAYVPWCTYVHDFKSPVKKKLVSSQPAIGSQELVQPTAPPASDNPPNYEEVMKQMQTFPVQKTDENTDSKECLADKTERWTAGDQGKPVKVSEDHCVIMIMRFADSCLMQFRTTLKQNGVKLTKRGGKVIAVAPQVLVTKGCWPAHTSIAILAFETYDSGSDWFKSFKQSSDASGVDIIDCSMFKGSSEEFQNEKYVFTLSVIRFEGDTKSEEFKSVSEKIKEIITPVRFEFGGRKICSGAGRQNLTDHTLYPDKYVKIYQWDSIQQSIGYKTLLEEKYEDILTPYNKFVKKDIEALFQSENTSYMMVQV